VELREYSEKHTRSVGYGDESQAFGVCRVLEQQAIRVREARDGFVKRDAVLSLVARCFLRVPFDLHELSVTHFDVSQGRKPASLDACCRLT